MSPTTAATAASAVRLPRLATANVRYKSPHKQVSVLLRRLYYLLSVVEW